MKESPKNKVFIDHSNPSHCIEQFTEHLSDQLLLNETYFGNILMTLSSLYEIFKSHEVKHPYILYYTTDFQVLNIHIHVPKSNVTKVVFNVVCLSNAPSDVFSDSVFLIKSLSEEITHNAEKLQVSFDISAIHRTIYEKRYTELLNFFSKSKSVSSAIIK